MRYLVMLLPLALSGCFLNDEALPPEVESNMDVRPEQLEKTEFAMYPGDEIVAVTEIGTIKVRADGWLRRSYTWEGATRSVMMWPRQERWYGSMGVYYPGPGNHWEEHNGIRRGVVSEGQMHFDSEEAAIAWIEGQEWMPYVYTSDGVVVGWDKNLPRNQLNVDVWQIMINGEKPANLAGANDDAVVVTRRESRRPR